MRIRKTTVACFKCLGVFGPLIGICDVLTPLAPFGLYITAILSLFLAVSLIIRFCIPRLNLAAQQSFPNTWYGSFFGINVTLCMLMTGAFLLGKHVQGNDGYLASKFEIVQDMQSDLNIIQESVDTIKHNVGSIEKKLELAKKETSDNPRKELANLGVAWTGEAFDKAIRERNIKIINLFLDGGMAARSNIDQKHNGILWLIGKDHLAGKNEVIELLLSRGLDPNLHSEFSYQMQLNSVMMSGGKSKRAKEVAADFAGSALAATARFYNDTAVLELLEKHGLKEEYL